MRSARRTVALMLVVALLVGAVAVLLRRSSSPEAGFAGPSGSSSGVDSGPAELARVTGDDLHREPASSQAMVSKQSTSAEMRLDECLARIAAIESSLLREGARADAVKELESLIGFVLERPETLATIIDNLASGTWGSGAAEELSATEYGACRALYWALLLLNQPGNDFHDATRGRDLFNDLLASIPRLNPRIQRFLIAQILEVRVDGKALVAHYLEDVLRMRALLAENRELFSSLLEKLGEEMTPGERDAFFSVFLSDTRDSTLLANTLKNLLRGTNPGAALQLAESLFDDPPGQTAQEKDQLRKAIALAVVTSLEDLYSATQFLETRAETLRNTPEVWFGLGAREDSFVVLEHAYQQLAATGANPVARERFVSGMVTGSPDQLLRLAEIASGDPDPRVRAQAFLTLTAAPSWTPSPGVVRDLRTGLDDGLPEMQVVGAAENVARKAASAGSPSIVNEAVELMREIALDTTNGAKERRRAAEALKAFLPAHEYESIVNSMN